MLGHSVKEIDRSNQRIIIVETAMSGAAVMFAVFALMGGVFLQDLIGAALAVIFSAMAVFRHLPDVHRRSKSSTVLVRRRIALWTVERLYPTDSIDRVYVRDYGRNGSGLVLRFRSGRNKRLTTCGDWLYDLESVAGALNHFVYTPHRGEQSRA